MNTFTLKIEANKIFLAGALILYLLLSASHISCSSPKTFAFTCQEKQIEIYINGEYLGREYVNYTVPKGCNTIEVSCRDAGIEVYHRELNIAGRNGNLIELQIPKNYRYSSKPF